MFKFGKYATLNGPYDKFRTPDADPLNVVTGSRSASFAASAESAKKTRSRIVSNFGGGGGYAGGPGGGMGAGGPGGGGGGAGFGGRGPGGYNIDHYNPVYDQLEEGSILEDWIPRDAAGLDLLYRRIYLRDPTIGPGIDIIRGLPWSDFSLAGIEDNEILKVYQECMDALNVQLLMPDLTYEFLVLGKNISSLIYDQRRGIFSGVVPHDPDFIKITPLPVYGFDPKCDFTLSAGFKKFLSSTDPRDMDARRSLPPAFLEAASKQQGFLPLDPISTIYLARKAAPNDSIGTSLLTRTLYFWAIEKALLNAQLASTRRRARSFIQVKAGIDGVWEPSIDEMDAIAGLIIQANEDPNGGVISTRTGVDISEPVGGGADFYKWSDELELFAKYKMQCIGISDALLSGDATYNNAEQARSVFVETLATLRSKITHKFFMKTLFPTIARIHGFVKRSPAELAHRIRTTPTPKPFGTAEETLQRYQYLAQYDSSIPVWARMNQITASRMTQRQIMQLPVGDLQVPTIEWSKQLKPNQDEKALDVLEKLQQNDYPVTLVQWATAAGFNPKNIEQDQQTDIKSRQKIALLKQQAEEAEGGGEEEEAGGDEGRVEVPENSDEIPTGEPEGGAPETEEVKQSLYKQAEKIGRASPVAKLSQIAIWRNNRCGPLGLSEANKTVSSLMKDHSPDLFKDQSALMNVLYHKLGSEKAHVMAYVLNRMGVSALPVDPKSAQKIAASARDSLNRYSSFNSAKAMLDMRRYEAEIQCLSRYTAPRASQNTPAGRSRVANVMAPGTGGTTVMSGYMDPSDLK
jgi:hypothetical protein